MINPKHYFNESGNLLIFLTRVKTCGFQKDLLYLEKCAAMPLRDLPLSQIKTTIVLNTFVTVISNKVPCCPRTGLDPHQKTKKKFQRIRKSMLIWNRHQLISYGATRVTADVVIVDNQHLIRIRLSDEEIKQPS